MKYLHLILLCWLLSACGSGSEDQIPIPLPAIQVSANVDITIDENTQIQIEGAATGGDGALTYAWQADPLIEIQHQDVSMADAVLVAPQVTTTSNYIVTLVVTDGRGKSASDTFTLTVNPVNLPPQATISVSQTEGYPVATFPVNTSITLDGSASTDPDALSEQDQIASYEWQQTAGTLVPTSSDLTAPVIELQTQVRNQRETIIFQLTVTDYEGAVHTSEIELVLLEQSMTIPTVELEPVSNGFSHEVIFVSATAASAAPNASPFSYAWREVSGNYPDINFTHSDQAQTAVILPSVATSSELELEVTVTDNFGNQVLGLQSVEVSPFPRQTVNDTGAQTINEWQSAFAGQDGYYGRDRVDATQNLPKAGTGQGGFDFTQLDANGDPVSDDQQSSHCVRDNVTGLVWEVKSLDASSLHYVHQRFTWYQDEANGNVTGPLNDQSQSCVLDSQRCNTQAYVDAVNSVGRCGFFDWRMPSHEELQSLLDYGATVSPMVDTENFPHWGVDADASSWYWTNQSAADGVLNDEANNAWALNFATGIDNFVHKSKENHVRLVRAGR